MAVCKLILQIDPRHDAALQRIAAMNEQIGAGPTRAVTMADNNPNLADNTAVAAMRRRGTTDQQQIADLDLEPEVAIPRTRTPNPTLLPEVRMTKGTQTPPFGSGGSRKSDREAIEQITTSCCRGRRRQRAVAGRAGAHQVQADHAAADSGIDAIDLKTEVPDRVRARGELRRLRHPDRRRGLHRRGDPPVDPADRRRADLRGDRARIERARRHRRARPRGHRRDSAAGAARPRSCRGRSARGDAAVLGPVARSARVAGRRAPAVSSSPTPRCCSTRAIRATRST